MASSCVSPITGDDLPMVDRHAAAAARSDGEIAHGQAARDVDVARERTGSGHTAAGSSELGTGESSAGSPVLHFAADAALLRFSETTQEAVVAEALAVARNRNRWRECRIAAAARKERVHLVEHAHEVPVLLDVGNGGDVGVVDHHRLRHVCRNTHGHCGWH